MSKLKHWGQDAPPSLSDVLQVEIDMRWSRETGMMRPFAQDIPLGAVLARDESGRFVPYMAELTPAVDSTPATFADKAVAVCISKLLPASETEQSCSVVARGVTVAAANLIWLPTVTDEQKQTALGQLKALGVVPTE